MPLTFVGAMLLGGALGFAGLALPAVEPMILASIVILGVLVALAARLPLTATLTATLPAIALFGAAHGWAHGAEGPATGMVAYATGFALMTAVLHGAGLVLGRKIGALPLRAAGGAAAVAGLALVVG
jgi:urease accessory protein